MWFQLLRLFKRDSKRSPNEMLTDLNNIVKSVEIGRIRMSKFVEFKMGT